jgi:hypothetical protein
MFSKGSTSDAPRVRLRRRRTRRSRGAGARHETIFISWVPSHGRSSALADALGAEPFFSSPGAKDENVLMRYVRLSCWTAKVIAYHRPKNVICMQPPLPAILVVRAMCFATRSRIVGDLHSGALNDPKWSWAFPLLMLMLRGHAAILSGKVFAERVTRWRVRTFIIHDPISPAAVSDFNRNTQVRFIYPASWADDEPLQELVDAVRGRDYTLYITGTPKRPLNLPDNVTCTGYLPGSEYEVLLARATAIIGLTTRTETMQRAGYEALERSIPLLTTRSRILLDYFGDAAVYCDNTAEGISRGLDFITNNQLHLRRQMRLRREIALTQAAGSLRELREYLRD